IGLFDFIKTADPWKFQAVEVQKGSSSVVVAEVFALTEEGQEDVAPEDAYLEMAEPDEGTTAVRQSEEEVVTEQPKKVKKNRLLKQSDVLPAKNLRMDHHTLVSGTDGKTLAGLEHIRPESEGFLDSSAQTNLRISTTVVSSSTLGILVDTTAADLAGPSQPVELEGSDDSFYEPPTLDPSKAKRCYVPRWNITNDSLLDDGFSYHTLVDRVASLAFFSALCTIDYDPLYTEFNTGATRQVCLGAEVRSRVKHELELRAKYTARGRLLEEKDLEILKLKSNWRRRRWKSRRLSASMIKFLHCPERNLL
ncbi:hypothetical protein Tco_1496734, partial [Tanacetum coccineum]